MAVNVMVKIRGEVGGQIVRRANVVRVTLGKRGFHRRFGNGQLHFRAVREI